jgi:hypothetical protein
MNHDYAHCLDFTEDCPVECFRAELSRDLKRMENGGRGMWLSWMSFKETGCCPLEGDDGK